jgi:PKD repeat protein
MKQSLLFMLAIFVSALVYGQQVERQQVIQEIGTGTWCVYCPGAAMGANDLLNSGADVAVIKYHSGDMYATSFTSARLSFYSISSFPTAKFDGVMTVAGGSPSSSLYSQYLPRYNTRKSTPSSFELSFDATTQGNTTDITITVEKVFTYSGTNLAVHMVLTETNIAHNWFNQQYVKNVSRLMIPNQNGTPVNFSSGDVQTVDLSFTMNAAWKKENSEIIVFIQDMSTKEILQGAKLMLAEFSTPDKEDEVIVCPGGVVTFIGQDMYNTSGWQWNFPGGDPETSSDSVVEVTYALSGVYDVQLTTSDGINTNTMIKTAYVTVIEAPETPSQPVGPEVVDLYYVNVSDYETNPVTDAEAYIWMLTPENAGTIEANENLATVSWNQDFMGQAYVSVQAIGEMCESLFSEELEVDVTNTVGINEQGYENEVTIYPNPVQNILNISIPANLSESVQNIRLFDINGKLVWEKNSKSWDTETQFDVSHLGNGVYILTISTHEDNKSYRINLIN